MKIQIFQNTSPVALAQEVNTFLSENIIEVKKVTKRPAPNKPMEETDEEFDRGTPPVVHFVTQSESAESNGDNSQIISRVTLTLWWD